VLPPSGKVGLRSVTTKAFCINIDILFPGQQELQEIKILISARLRNTEKNEIFFNPGGRCCPLNHVSHHGNNYRLVGSKTEFGPTIRHLFQNRPMRSITLIIERRVSLRATRAIRKHTKASS
jgi:hypothetical protein